ncbi:ribosomal protein S18-alanine N-acetyltransferase [Candidatus Bathyarchaeota archaeon]|nr:ribosomal protein S18-alanine N-acetyltransferase [Candidatus Bathyarchaeota archaeon]
MTTTIETASMRHLDRLTEIEVECFGKEAFTRKQIASLLTDYNSISLVAKEDGKIAGFVIGMVSIETDSPIGHILTLDVSPQYRRKRIGLRLLQEIERIFSKKGVGTCYLEAREDNLQALNLYEKTGYKRIGRLKNYYGDAHGIHLRKDFPVSKTPEQEG